MPAESTGTRDRDATPPAGGETPHAGLSLDDYDLAPDDERHARLARQWREGRADPDYVISLYRTVPEDALSMTLGELLVTLDDGAVQRPQAMFHVWGRAQVALDAVRLWRHIAYRVGLVPERRRWRAVLEANGTVSRWDEREYRRPERALRSLERGCRRLVAEEARLIEAVRAARKSQQASAESATTPGGKEPEQPREEGAAPKEQIDATSTPVGTDEAPAQTPVTGEGTESSADA